MSHITEKKLNQLKSKSIIGSVVSLLIALSIGALIVGSTVLGILAYIVQSDYLDANDQADDIQKKIEARLSDGYEYEDILNEINGEMSHPLAINVCSKKGKVIANYGDKIDLDDSNIVSSNLDVRFNFDNDIDIDDISSNSRVILSIPELFINLSEVDDDNATINEILRQEVYSYNFWIKKYIQNTSETIYIKYEHSIYFDDCVIMMMSLAVAALIYVLMVIFYFINTISNIVSQRKLLKLLLKDTLTEENNYLGFTYNATKILSFHKSKEYAILDFTIVKYQNYCTLYGTSEGERLLNAIAYFLNRNLSRGETHARVSNASFIILLKNTARKDLPSDIITKANRLLEIFPVEMHNYGKQNGEPIQGINNLKIKAGLYVIDAALDKESREKRKKKNIDIEQLYIKAGIAKNELKNEFGLKIYNHDMWEKELWEQKVEAKMQAALVAKEFHVYIQPKYNPVTNELAGGEALVRWISPTEGLIPPGRFIPIFEKTGFITKLDDYMILYTAYLQAKWIHEGRKIVPISVNVSRAHFSQPNLAEHIRDLVDQYPIPHECIEIELTESAFFDDKAVLLSTVQKLQEYGFEVSMDDFGAGYSSLNSLKDLPLNVLKLDAEFFRGDDFDTRGEIVVEEAISLAKKLNMRIVAEGIEKEEQVEFLANLNCDMIQGFYYAKPMPANEYEERMEMVNQEASTTP